MELDLNNWMLVFMRASALVLLFPVLSGPNIPIHIRVALGALLATLVAPMLPPAPLPRDSLLGLGLVMGREVFVGLFLGFVSRLIFFGVDLAGGIIASEIGLSVPASMAPLGGGSNTQIGLLLYLLSALLWFGLDLHHVTLVAFQRSYELAPIGTGHISEVLAFDLVRRSGQLFAVALLMAAPMLATSFVLMLVFSVLGRAIPQMNVFTESFSVRILAGLSVFGLTCHLMATHISNLLRRLPEDLLRVAQLLGAA